MGFQRLGFRGLQFMLARVRRDPNGFYRVLYCTGLIYASKVSKGSIKLCTNATEVQ